MLLRRGQSRWAPTGSVRHACAAWAFLVHHGHPRGVCSMRVQHGRSWFNMGIQRGVCSMRVQHSQEVCNIGVRGIYGTLQNGW